MATYSCIHQHVFSSSYNYRYVKTLCSITESEPGFVKVVSEAILTTSRYGTGMETQGIWR